MRTNTQLLSLFLAFILTPSPTRSQEPALTTGSKFEAMEVPHLVNARNDGKQLSHTLEIEVTDARGRVRKRAAKAFRRYTDTAKQSLIRYTEPSSVRGTSFLTWDEREGEDSQWLYLPELRRVRRISTSDRGSTFLGTDFTYENIKTELKVALEDYEWLPWGWQGIEGCSCLVVEGRTKSPALAKELGHTTQRIWIDPEKWIVVKVEYYDQTAKLRTITAHEVKEVQGIWTPHVLRCENHQTDGVSTFRFSEHDYESSIDEVLFTQESLRRQAN